MSAIDEIITLYNSGCSATPMNGKDIQNVIDARAEIEQLRSDRAQLRADRAQLLDDVAALQGKLRATVAEQARQLAEAYRMIEFFKSLAVLDEMDAWLAANPAQRCTCGMGDATKPELHAKDCDLIALQEDATK